MRYPAVVFWWLICASIVMARESPNAEFFREMLKMPEYASFSVNEVIEDALLDVPDLVKKYGYPCEIHTVITKDGYILEMHRIPHGRNDIVEKKRTPVLMMHGILMSSADFVIGGPGSSLAYRLADEGYDVWLGNARGNYYSRKHLFLDPDSRIQIFWLFSWDEIGRIDTAAFIDRIMKVTKFEKIQYVGFSQGGTSFLTLLSLRPEYNQKLISVIGLAPASFFIHNKTPSMVALGPKGDEIERLARTLGFSEMFGRSHAQKWVATNICPETSKLQPLCLAIPLLGKYLVGVNHTMIPVFLGHSPAGTSVRQVNHYAQSYRDKNFARYDYNSPIINLLKYKRLKPPNYDLSKVIVPTYILHSDGDILVNPKDVIHLVSKLPNVKALTKVSRKDFTHLDFVWGRDVSTQVNDHVVRTLKESSVGEEKNTGMDDDLKNIIEEDKIEDNESKDLKHIPITKIKC